ncbi:hypothetical protein J437_LFUL003651 [Ladona fulva]|uniref:Uncharacterized protein n=1 Tax=Ladona fulva TaxID=123851 RepID=A0A8K0K469_LADFU|nr:hypothetical protein J437_LFUL003651 [Ladona fulva]
MGSSHRPKKLFSQSRVAGDSGIMDSTALKEDGNLEEFTEEGIQNPLQTATKLVPVPESIVSPEYRPATSYMPTTAVRQGHMSSVSAEPERRRAQGWGSDRVPARSSSTSSHCFNHPQQNYFPAGNYSMNSTISPQNMVGSSCNVPAGPSSSPGTRRANQNQQQHSSCSSSEATRCRHQHQNTNSSANVGASSSSVPTRGPPPVPSYFPASTSSNSTNTGSSRHSCNISSFYHNQVQPSQTDCQSKNLQRTRRSNSRTTGDTSTPHSPAMSRVRRIPTSGRGIGAKIRKPTEGEGVRGGSSRASRGGAHGKSEKEGDIEGRESSGDNSDSEMSISKLEAIKCVAVERRHRKEDGSADLKDEKPIMDNPEKIKAAQEKAALKIQSLWRGYRYRKESKVDKSDEAPVDYQSLKEEIQSMRVEDHIRQLSSELEATRGELGKERKLRLQQMEAIKALWKEVYSLQPKNVVNGLQSPNDESVNLPTSSVSLPTVDGKEQPAMVDAKIVAELTRTCANLQGQVQQLSESLQQVMQHISPFKAEGEINRDERVANTNAAIQTYISAVFTPQGPCASFPFGFKEDGERKAAETQANSDCRPSYLPIFEERVKKVLKRPSEEGNDSEGHLEEENEISETKEGDYEEPPSQEVKHYVEGLVDGVLKAVFSAEEEETEKSGCSVQCPVAFLSNEQADDK